MSLNWVVAGRKRRITNLGFSEFALVGEVAQF